MTTMTKQAEQNVSLRLATEELESRKVAQSQADVDAAWSMARLCADVDNGTADGPSPEDVIAAYEAADWSYAQFWKAVELIKQRQADAVLFSKGAAAHAEMAKCENERQVLVE